MGKGSKINESQALSLCPSANPPLQPTREDVCRVHSGSFRADG